MAIAKKPIFQTKLQKKSESYYNKKFQKNYSNYQQKNIKLFVLIIIFNLFICSTNSQQSYSTQCHSSCQYCINPQFSQCYVCNANFQLTILSQQTNQSNFNTLEQYPKGSCIGALLPINVLGILFLIILVAALFITKNRVFFYFISSIQSLALISLLQIGYLNPLSYVLQSFEWFMFLGNISKFFSPYTYNLYNSQKYRLGNMFYSIEIRTNMILVGSISLLSFLIVFTIPIIRWVNKKFCLNGEQQKSKLKQQNNKSVSQMIQNSNNGQRKDKVDGSQNHKIQNQNTSIFSFQLILKRLQLIFAIVFFFTIQQAILIFAVGLKYSSQLASGDIAIIVVYGIIMGLMISNQCLKQLRVFPNKLVQATDTLKKCTFPLFMIMPYDYGFFILIFLFLLNLVQIFCIKKLSIKEQYKLDVLKKKAKYQFVVQYQQSLSRQFKYRLIQQVAIVLIAIFYVIDTLLNNYSASLACSVFAFIGFFIFLICIFVEIGMEVRSKVEIQQKIIPESMQNRNQQKLQQRDHTQQNILTTSQGFVQTLFLNNFQNTTFQEQIQPPKVARKEHQQNVFNQEEIEEEKPRQMELQNLSQNVTHRSQKTQILTPKHSVMKFPKQKQSIDDDIPSPLGLTPRSKPKRRDKNRIKSSLGVGQSQQKIQSLTLQKQEQNQFQSTKKLMNQQEQQQKQEEVPHFVGQQIQQIKQQKVKKQTNKQKIEAILTGATDPKKKQLRERYLQPAKKKQKNLDMITNN